MPATLSNPPPFFGQANYSLDEKGRVTVPVDWRVPEVESEVFYLVPDSKGACLRVMRSDRFTQFGEDARKVVGNDEKKHRVFMRNFFANCAKASTDKQGRIAIPKDYCERFNLKGEVMLAGSDDLFEIWNKAAYAARQKTEAPVFADVADALGL